MVTKVIELVDRLPYGTVDQPMVYGPYITRSARKVYTETPNYEALRAAKRTLAISSPWIAPTNSYEHRQMRLVLPTQSVMSKVVGAITPPMLFYGNLGFLSASDITLPTAVNTSLYNKCLTKMAGRINGTSFNVPMFLSDFHRTVKMFDMVVQDLVRMYTVHRTARAKADFLNGNVWLEWRYGWRLLLKDIEDSLKAIHDARLAGVPMKVKVMSEQVRTGKDNRYYGQFPRAFHNAIRNDISFTYEDYDQTVVTVYYSDTYSQTLGTLQQFGITNPLLLAWDLSAASFVVDWVFPVADYLSTLDTFIGKKFVGGCISYIHSQKLSVRPTNLRGDTAIRAFSVVNTPDSVMEARWYKRVPLYDFPTASFKGLVLNLDIPKTLDGLALLRQVISRRKT